MNPTSHSQENPKSAGSNSSEPTHKTPHAKSQAKYFETNRRGRGRRIVVNESTYRRLSNFGGTAHGPFSDKRLSRATIGLAEFLAETQFEQWINLPQLPIRHAKVPTAHKRPGLTEHRIRGIFIENENPLNPKTLRALLRLIEGLAPTPAAERKIELWVPEHCAAQLIEAGAKLNQEPARRFVATSRKIPPLYAVIEWLVTTPPFAAALARRQTTAATPAITAAPEDPQAAKPESQGGPGSVATVFSPPEENSRELKISPTEGHPDE